MDDRLEEFRSYIARWAQLGLSAGVIVDRLAEHGCLVSSRQLKRYCQEAGIPLVDGEMSAETVAQRELRQIARATDPGPRRPLPPPPFPPVVKRGQWPTDRVLVYFNEFALTIAQALEGIFVLGATGSGKSSGSGKTIIHAVLWVEAGAVIFIVKAGEAAIYVRWAAECGRLQHVCVFEPGGKYRFNFFEYLTRHPSPGVSSEQNVTHVLEALAEISAGGSDRGGGENAAFWTNNRRQVLSCAIRILARSGTPLTLPLLKKFIGEAPLDAKDVQQGAYQRTAVFGPCMAAAVARSRGTPDEEAVREACDFFLRERAVRQPETTRASVAMDINSMIEAFIGNPMMRELFCTDTNLVPEHCLAGGLIVVNVDVATYGTQGILANTIWKLLVQQMLGRRPSGENRIPVAMITDEVHYLYTPSDTLFSSTCRSLNCITIGITQSLPSFYATVRGPNPQHVVDGYLANFVTKVFHYNNDPTSLIYMSEQLGRARRFRVSGSDKKKSWFSQLFGGGGGSGGDDGLNVSSEDSLNVPLEKFTQLRTGGPENNYEVDAYVVLGPRAYRQIGQHYALVTFRQNGEDEEGGADEREISDSRTWWRRLKSGLRRLIGS